MPARKPAAKTTARTDPAERLAEAALKRLARTSWSELTLVGVARLARVPLGDLQTLCGSKAALFGLILRRLGRMAAARYVPEPGTAHDRLFEVVMCWFDVLAPHKKAVAALHAGLRRDPVTLLAARGGIVEAANWLLTLAEADTGPALPLRALGLAAAVGRTVPVWLDDGPDLAKTMARLDTDLTRGETLLDRLRGAQSDDGEA